MRGLPLIAAAALAASGCALPPAAGPGGLVGTLDVDGPNAYLNRVPARAGERVHLGDRVSTGPGTSVKVLLGASGSVQLDENTDPDFFREAGCLVVHFFTGQIFVDGTGICVHGPDFAARQNSRVQYARFGTRIEIVVLEGSTTLQLPTTVSLTQYDHFSITGGRPDGPPRRLARQQTEGLIAWRANYFATRTRVRPSPQPPSQPQPTGSPQPPPQPQPTGPRWTPKPGQSWTPEIRSGR